MCPMCSGTPFAADMGMMMLDNVTRYTRLGNGKIKKERAVEAVGSNSLCVRVR